MTNWKGPDEPGGRHSADPPPQTYPKTPSNEAALFTELCAAKAELAAIIEAKEILWESFLKMTRLENEARLSSTILGQTVTDLHDRLKERQAERDHLQKFKTWVHEYLDSHGVPHHPPGTRGAAGCRIGDRMDWLMAQLAELRRELEEQ